MMGIRYDPEADATYLPVSRELHGGEAVHQVHGIRDPFEHGEIILDFDETGHLIGVGILYASHLLRPEDLDRAQRSAESDGVVNRDDHT